MSWCRQRLYVVYGYMYILLSHPASVSAGSLSSLHFLLLFHRVRGRVCMRVGGRWLLYCQCVSGSVWVLAVCIHCMCEERRMERAAESQHSRTDKYTRMQEYKVEGIRIQGCVSGFYNKGLYCKLMHWPVYHCQQCSQIQFRILVFVSMSIHQHQLSVSLLYKRLKGN